MNTGMHRQQGTTLVIALIMLVIITMLAVSALGTTQMSLKVVNNMQSRGEALQASQQAIETVISTPLFITNPANAVLTPCGSANTLCSDLSGDGAPDYTTRLNPAPSCNSAKVVKVNELNLSNNEDLGCAAGQPQQFGITGVGSGDSLCANATWDITAETSATISRTRVTVTQGVAVRINVDDVATSCL